MVGLRSSRGSCDGDGVKGGQDEGCRVWAADGSGLEWEWWLVVDGGLVRTKYSGHFFELCLFFNL